MASAIKLKLSGSTDGRPIKVAATATPGTTIHTAGATSDGSILDEVWIWACNTTTTAVKLTIEYGGTSSPDDQIELSLAGEAGLALVIPGFVLQNSCVIKAFCGSANNINIIGFVNRITN